MREIEVVLKEHAAIRFAARTRKSCTYDTELGILDRAYSEGAVLCNPEDRYVWDIFYESLEGYFVLRPLLLAGAAVQRAGRRGREGSLEIRSLQTTRG